MFLRATLWCALSILIVLVPAPASQPAPAALQVGPHTGVTRPDWITFTTACARHYRVRPALVLGVAYAEGSKGTVPFRFGKFNIYYLPWGIHEYVVKPPRSWPVWDIYVQTEVAVRALSRHMARVRRDHPGLSERGVEELALRKYSASCNPAYLKRVRQGERMFGGMVK